MPQSKSQEILCPVCQLPLRETQTKENILIDICEQCWGIWLDGDELEYANCEQGLPTPEQHHSGDKSCPRCGDQMNVFSYTIHNEDLTVDQCPQCQGVWLDDKKELIKLRWVIELFQKKGEFLSGGGEVEKVGLALLESPSEDTKQVSQQGLATNIVSMLATMLPSFGFAYLFFAKWTDPGSFPNIRVESLIAMSLFVMIEFCFFFILVGISSVRVSIRNFIQNIKLAGCLTLFVLLPICFGLAFVLDLWLGIVLAFYVIRDTVNISKGLLSSKRTLVIGTAVAGIILFLAARTLNIPELGLSGYVLEGEIWQDMTMDVVDVFICLKREPYRLIFFGASYFTVIGLGELIAGLNIIRHY